MKTYDLSLTIIRTLVVVEIAQQIAGFVWAILSLSTDPSVVARSVGEPDARMTLLQAVLGPIFSIVTSLLIWWASPWLARFAARFAASNEAAQQA